MSCGAPPVASDSPEAVAEEFWSAIEARDLAAARALSVAAKARQLDALFNDRRVQSVFLGETLSNEASAIVHTSLVEPGNERALEFDTHLERFDGAWRVDIEQTAAEIRTAGFASAIDEVQDALREGERVIAEALEQGAREASQALRDALDEMDRALGRPPAP